MTTANPASTYKVWGIDDMIYGPYELPKLVDYVLDDRIAPDTWIYCVDDAQWRRAKDVTELRGAFSARGGAAPDEPGTATWFNPLLPAARSYSLRRVKVLAALTDAQLGRFGALMGLRTARPYEVVVKKDDPGDSMYLIVEGEVRVRLLVNQRERLLATLGAGEFFGETCLFDQGVRSADVVSNTETTLLEITIEKFRKLVVDHPDIAAPFLLGIGRTLSARIRADNRRFHDFVAIRLAMGEEA